MSVYPKTEQTSKHCVVAWHNHDHYEVYEYRTQSGLVHYERVAAGQVRDSRWMSAEEADGCCIRLGVDPGFYFLSPRRGLDGVQAAIHERIDAIVARAVNKLEALAREYAGVDSRRTHGAA